MADPAALALIPVGGAIAVALIAGLFQRSNKRTEVQVAELAAADRVRARLVEDLEARIAVLTVDRNEARADRDESRRQVLALEARLVELGRPTRGVKP